MPRRQYRQEDIIDILFFEKCEESVAPLGIIHIYFELQISAFFGYIDLNEPRIIKEESINYNQAKSVKEFHTGNVNFLCLHFSLFSDKSIIK